MTARRTNDFHPRLALRSTSLQSGDVILEINHQSIKSAEDAIKDTVKPMGSETEDLERRR